MTNKSLSQSDRLALSRHTREHRSAPAGYSGEIFEREDRNKQSLSSHHAIFSRHLGVSGPDWVMGFGRESYSE